MIKLLAAASIASALAGCGAMEPTLAEVSWSRASYPPPDFSRWDEPLPEPTTNVIKVWSTTYARQDMSRARGWIRTTASEVVLCFSAPTDPSSPYIDASAAYQTLLTYRFATTSDLPAKTRFGGECAGL